MKYYVYATAFKIASLHFQKGIQCYQCVYIDSANQIECKGVVDGCALTAPEEDEEQKKVDAE